MKRFVLAALAAFFVSGAMAQDCYTPDALLADMREEGGELVEFVHVPNGVGFDSLMIVEYIVPESTRGALVGARVLGGCVVSAPVLIGPITKRQSA